MATRAKSKDSPWELFKTVFWALTIAMAFRSTLYQPFYIPSGSMLPSLLVGDFVFVSKFAYGYSRYSLPFAPDVFDGRIWSAAPERGDVIVFKNPTADTCSQGPIGMVVGIIGGLTGTVRPAVDDCQDYVKRLIGLPGDRVQMIGGVLHLNGAPVPTLRDGDYIEVKAIRGSPPRPPSCMNEPVPLGGPCIAERWRESLPGGRAHAILNIQGTLGDPLSGSPGDNTPILTVPQGQYLFMGDNRDNSQDSRFAGLGMVPFENLVGRVEIIGLSSDGAFWQFWRWRLGRFFMLVE